LKNKKTQNMSIRVGGSVGAIGTGAFGIIGGIAGPNLEKINIDMDGDSFVTVNGVAIPGRTISMTNGVLFVDGKRYEEKEGEAGAVVGCKELTIVINGNVRGSVSTTSGNVKVTGNCETAKSVSGDVEIDGDVTGSVSSVSGDVRVSGKVSGSASSISGRVTTGGASRR
jgi:hypothetical protein